MDLEDPRQLHKVVFDMKRQNMLYFRYERYRKDTPESMSNKDALPIWKEFTKWCAEMDYTQDEINEVKRNYSNEF